MGWQERALTGSALVDIGLGLWSQSLVALTLLGFEMLPSTLPSINFEHQLCARPKDPE